METSKKILTPVKAIRAKCLDCCCNQIVEVRLCTCTDCALYPYRMGHRPKKADSLTDDAITEENEDSTIVISKNAYDGRKETE